jgi:hypothetical protein
MRRLWFLLFTVLWLAACSNAPQKNSRGSSSAGVAGNAYRTAPPPGFPNFVDHSVGREEISIQAMGLVGVPYRWGGNTPDSGFDCSGLVRYVLLRAASVDLPRTTADMSGRGESIEPNGIAPGDLIFFNTTGRAHSHVGIYVGKLRFVNAPSTGGTVRLDYLTNTYWAKRFDGIRRMAPALAKPTPFEEPAYLAAPREASPPESPVPATIGTPYAGTSAASSSTTAIPAAQAQARTANPVPPPVELAAPPNVANDVPGTRQAPPITAPGTRAYVPDDINAAADAFEPPPASAELAQQQAQQAAANGVGVPRASPASPSAPAQSSTTDDDPIARFANGH